MRVRLTQGYTLRGSEMQLEPGAIVEVYGEELERVLNEGVAVPVTHEFAVERR